jgi:hypothetical protein
MNKWYLEFPYNEIGKGTLILMEGNLISMILKARTGSIDVDGDLIKAIKPGIWSIRDPSIVTYEEGMRVVKNEPARKIRLYTPKGNFSHYLIHPDGGKPGSSGCIVTGIEYGNAPELFSRLDRIVKKQIIPVYINTPIPTEVKNGYA